MILMLLVSGSLAFAINYILLTYFHLVSIHLRYTLVILSGYLLLILSIKCWLHFIFPGLSFFSENSFSDMDLINVGLDGLPNGPSATPFQSGGGRFSGGGASASFENASQVPRLTLDKAPIPKASSNGFDLPDLDADALPFAVILALGALILALLSVMFSIVIMAPGILGEVAFEVALSIGFYRTFKKNLEKGRKSEGSKWFWVAVKRTLPFLAILLVVNLIACSLILHFYPSIQKIGDIFSKP